MADEISQDAKVDTTVPQEESKKKRAPRRSKEEMEAARAAKKNAKDLRNTASPVVSASAAKKPIRKVIAKASASKGSAKSTSLPGTPVSAPSDEFADLLALEQENQKLRKSLAEKLRAENLDLRKKLGLS